MSQSIVIRRSLGRRLKALREQAGKTVADVHASHIASPAKVHRIEGGQVPIKVSDIVALCQLYGASGAEAETLKTLATTSTEGGWWEDYDDAMPSWFANYVELEAAASAVQVYDPELIYGLLQTPGYQRATFEAVPWLEPASTERRMKLRQQRQRAAFDRNPPLNVTFIMGAGVLARQVGGPEAMREQREYLLKLARDSRAELRVVPWDVGAHASMTGPFVILRFEGDHPDVLYLETVAAGRYIEKDDTVAEYRRRFDATYRQTVSIKEFLT